MSDERRMTPDGLAIYRIPADHMPGLMFKLDKVSRKAKRLLGQTIGLNVLDEVHEPAVMMRGTAQVPLLDVDGKQIINISYDVTIPVPIVKIPGWQFIATIDHTPAAGNIIRVVPNVDFEPDARYRSVKPICEHCNKIRGRRDTYLLRSDAGEIKQIGRQCIRDFLGHDVEHLTAMAEIYIHCLPGEGDADQDWVGGMRDRRYIFVRTYMAHVSRMMRACGWISRKDVEYRQDGTQSTASLAHSNMFPPPGNKDPKNKPLELTEEDYQSADAALTWAKEMTPRSEFDTNMHILAQEDMIEGRSMGILAYILPAYLKHVQQEFARLERRTAMRLEDSKHVGAKGERLRNIAAVLYGYYPTVGYGGMAAYIYRFQTTDGNVLSWKSSQGVEGLGLMAAKARTPVKIVAGTVKDHTEYNGVKETRLSRCEVTIVETETEAEAA